MDDIKIGDHVIWGDSNQRQSGEAMAFSADGKKVFVKMLSHHHRHRCTRQYEYVSVPRYKVEKMRL